MPMAAEDVWMRQARTSITRTRRLLDLLLLETMMTCVEANEEIYGGA
jgi:hypothetical protein